MLLVGGVGLLVLLFGWALFRDENSIGLVNLVGFFAMLAGLMMMGVGLLGLTDLLRNQSWPVRRTSIEIGRGETMAQIQCPNCGGYKTSASTRHVEKVPVSMLRKVSLLVIGAVIIVGWRVWIASMGSSVPLESKFVNIFSFALAVFVVIAAATLKRNATTGYGFVCNLCGYTWNWMLGTPLPSVKAQPDLIAAGAQRLEAEKAAYEAVECC